MELKERRSSCDRDECCAGAFSSGKGSSDEWLASEGGGADPGIGAVASGIGELLLGSGILIKNCVGVAALIILALLGLLPFLKILCITVFYKLAAVVAEPVTDMRIAGCLKGMAEGGVLYLKLILYCLSLFFVTIALTTAASGLLA